MGKRGDAGSTRAGAGGKDEIGPLAYLYRKMVLTPQVYHILSINSLAKSIILANPSKGGDAKLWVYKLCKAMTAKLPSGC